MVFRYFMLQAHYSGELNITDKGLAAAEKGYRRLMDANQALQALKHSGQENVGGEDQQINVLLDKAFEAMNDDFNTAAAIGKLNGVVAKINSLANGRLDMSSIKASTLERMQTVFNELLFDVFGLLDEQSGAASTGTSNQGQLLEAAMQVVLELRQEARTNKDWATSDLIRDRLQEAGIQIKDSKEGASWSKMLS
jgi:cysteinyl-tRNA synthetase